MKKKFDKEVKIYSGLILFFTFIPLVLYFIFFFKNGLSKDTSNWSEFGDFIGGYGSLIIGAGNLYFLIKISYKLSEIDEDRNNQNNESEERRNNQNKRDAVVPFLILKSYDDLIKYKNLRIDLRNCGIGPAIIDYYKLTYNGNEYSKFEEIITDININNPSLIIESIVSSELRSLRSAISPNEDQNLLDLTIGKVDYKTIDNPKEMYNLVRNELCKVYIEISYHDLYENPVKILKHIENQQTSSN